MVMFEALACGTPVVARAKGAAPEIVGHGTVGFLGRTDADLEVGLHDLDRIDRLTCRTWAAQRFSLELMAKRYEERSTSWPWRAPRPPEPDKGSRVARGVGKGMAATAPGDRPRHGRCRRAQRIPPRSLR